VRKIKKSFQPAFETREVRNFKDMNICAAQNMIHQAPWWNLMLFEDIDNKFELFRNYQNYYEYAYSDKEAQSEDNNANMDVTRIQELYNNRRKAQI
jgi:hypothetical protein